MFISVSILSMDKSDATPMPGASVTRMVDFLM